MEEDDSFNATLVSNIRRFGELIEKTREYKVNKNGDIKRMTLDELGAF